MPSGPRSSLTCWLHNRASAHISGSRTRRGENHAEVRGGLGSQAAQGVFSHSEDRPLSSAAVLRDPWHVRRPPLCPEGGGNGNKTYTLTLDPHGPSIVSAVFTFQGHGCVNAADEGARSMREEQLCVCVCVIETDGAVGRAEPQVNIIARQLSVCSFVLRSTTACD